MYQCLLARETLRAWSARPVAACVIAFRLCVSRPDLGKRGVQGAYFYRIIDRFIDQSGVDTESVFGGQFKDDAGGTALVHDRKGLLSMANMGPNTNTAHFSIMQVTGWHTGYQRTVAQSCR